MPPCLLTCEFALTKGSRSDLSFLSGSGETVRVFFSPLQLKLVSINLRVAILSMPLLRLIPHNETMGFSKGNRFVSSYFRGKQGWMDDIFFLSFFFAWFGVNWICKKDPANRINILYFERIGRVVEEYFSAVSTDRMFHCLTDFLSMYIYIYISARFIVPLQKRRMEKRIQWYTARRHDLYARFPPIKTRGSASRWIERKEVHY